MADAMHGFSAREWRTLRSLKTPAGIQRLLNALSYHDADTAWSPRRVLREGTGHCLEGGILAAAALRAIGHAPLILDLEGEKDDDHIIAVYRERGHWGAVSKSHFNGLRERPPIFRTPRELALSYFEDYYNGRGERTLRRYSRPIDLSRFDHLDWMTTERPIWFVPRYLVEEARHIPLISRAQAKSLVRLDRLSIQAGLIGYDHSHMFANGKSIYAELAHTDPRIRGEWSGRP
ncbi:MAG: hypothetical protein ACHQY2_04210 [Candidatus Eremiobacterales bacterium]